MKKSILQKIFQKKERSSDKKDIETIETDSENIPKSTYFKEKMEDLEERHTKHY